MREFFNLDNPVWVFMGKVGDLIILNFLAIICSLPIVTIGASWTAMYFVTVRMVKKEESYVAKDFFRSFKENFKQATIIWLIALVMIAIFVGDILVYMMIPDKIPTIVLGVVCFAAFLVFGTIAYVFPVLARFHNTTKNTIKNAFLLSIANVPYTLLFLIFILISIVLLIYVMPLAPLAVLLGVSAPAYGFSLLLVRAFKKVEPAEISEEETAEE